MCGYWVLSRVLNTPCTLEIVLLRVHAPRGLFRVPFLPDPPPLSDGNLLPAALLRVRGNYFRPYLSIFACAIEVQHNKGNSTTTVIQASFEKADWKLEPKWSNENKKPEAATLRSIALNYIK